MKAHNQISMPPLPLFTLFLYYCSSFVDSVVMFTPNSFCRLAITTTTTTTSSSHRRGRCCLLVVVVVLLCFAKYCCTTISHSVVSVVSVVSTGAYALDMHYYYSLSVPPLLSIATVNRDVFVLHLLIFI